MGNGSTDCQGRECCDWNLCNDVIFNFGSDQCRDVGDFLNVVGNSHCKLGYAVPKAVKIHSIGVTWCGAPRCGAVAWTLVINGQDFVVDSLYIDSQDDKCGHLCVNGLDILVPECSTIAIKESQFEDEPYDSACSVEISVWAEAVCDRKPKKEEDGVFEAYTPTSVIPGDFSQVYGAIIFTTTRLNTLPSYISYNGSETITLKEGVYRLDGHVFLTWEKSVNLRVSTVIAVDTGSGYNIIPGSEDDNSVLNGTVGAVTCSNSIFFEVPVGQTWNFQYWGLATADTADYANYGANFMVERIANGVTC